MSSAQKPRIVSEVRIKYLTTYSPELNLIEILWRNIKYTWLPFSAYQGLNALRDALENILKKLWVKIPNYFCLSTYSGCIRVQCRLHCGRHEGDSRSAASLVPEWPQRD